MSLKARQVVFHWCCANHVGYEIAFTSGWRVLLFA